MGKGGARPGAGRKKGGKDAATIDKEKAYAAMRERILKITDSLLNSQLSLAKGQMMLYRIDTVTGVDGKKKRKKPKLVTDQWEIEQYLDALENEELNEVNNDKTYYFLTTKVPSNKALDSLLNRAYGKPIEHVEMTGPGGKELKPTVIFIPKDAEKEVD